jgi:hypothetical protein
MKVSGARQQQQHEKDGTLHTVSFTVRRLVA